jgi:hypothetical protein
VLPSKNCTVPPGALPLMFTLRLKVWPAVSVVADGLRVVDVVASTALTVCTKGCEVLARLLVSPE